MALMQSGPGRGPRLGLNPILCDGAGYCAEMVPELVDLDDWGFPIIGTDPILDRSILRNARRAVAHCPRVALALLYPEAGD
jgi:ferredoxin